MTKEKREKKEQGAKPQLLRWVDYTYCPSQQAKEIRNISMAPPVSVDYYAVLGVSQSNCRSYRTTRSIAEHTSNQREYSLVGESILISVVIVLGLSSLQQPVGTRFQASVTAQVHTHNLSRSLQRVVV